ncbi:hypothetical protein MPSEU_000278500 [Mayamaea pseudoterrestris]|nr:hypothetical protein MPSEU_000278500 [Mayamaea pseudoterrestris]
MMICFAMLIRSAILVLLLPWHIQALTYEEAGVLDFTVATAGHGPMKPNSLAALVKTECVLTSDAGAEMQGSSCYVACRSLQDGSLKWRRNVCSSIRDDRFNVLYEPINERLFSIDSSSIIRCWGANDGSLLWEQPLPQDEGWTSLKANNEGEAIQVASKSKVHVFDASNGDFLSQRAGGISVNMRRPELSLDCRGQHTSLDLSCTKIATNQGDLVDLGLAPDDQADDLRLLVCQDDSSATLLVTTVRGVSVIASCTTSSCKIGWTAHEGLSSVSQAILLDSSHKLKHNQVNNLLHFKSRLTSQWNRISSFSALAETETNNHLFGFIKSALLLSSTSHAVYGMDTIGEHRAQVSFVVNLPNDSGTKHVMVHGAANGPRGTHGIQGGTLSKQVLIVSHSADQLHWNCIDGTTGYTLSSKANVHLSSPIVQILPVSTSSSSDECQQSAMVVLKDGSVLAAPDSEQVVKAIGATLSLTQNGFYTHAIDREKALFETFWISSLDSKLIPTGSTSFINERIVHVAHPMRDEVISSPSVAVGDDSLLLKYINPHLMVIVTARNDSMTTNKLKASLALEAAAGEGSGKQSRKPLGVTVDDGSAASTIPDEPNLYVNIVDSVSGRVLYRISHANAVANPRPAVAISENWIYYTFSNAKTRRAELGVLSLYEGMIDSKGLTAFTASDQSQVFSSLDARESKPLVLAKMYSLARPITAIGVTMTHRGISNHRLVLAGADGQLYNIDRKTVDPRRPVGDLKEAEKKEGLVQYSEYIPMISFLSLSYNQTIENVTGIITAPTDLESQSLILAFGGPDLFFSRTSPSRGFDLLPASFSRPLLSILVVGLLLVLVIVKHRVSRKIRLSGWA